MATDVDALEEGRFFAARAQLLKERIMFDLRDTRSLAEFQAHLREHLDRLSQTGRPQVLATEGGPEFVIQSAEAYRELLRRLDYAETALDIDRGIDAAERGETVPLDEAFEKIRNGAWFQSNLREHLNGLSQTRQPQVLATEGAQFIIQSSEAYKELLRRLEYAECVIGIRKGREAAARGDSLPLDEAFEEIRRDAERRSP
jgi:PHD/YefM family antitoxin component YafN of YafNO toxin-antitoxin module